MAAPHARHASPTIVATSVVHPERHYRQDEIAQALAQAMGLDEREGRVLRQMHAQCGVQTRNLVMDLSRYGRLSGFTEANDLWMSEGGVLLERAAKEALSAANISAEEVDVLYFVSVTGISAPSLDARLISTVGFRPDIKRVPIFGLGCVAGASGIARIADALRGSRDKVGLLLSLELCSLTVQIQDQSRANYVATGLFGDAASAVVLAPRGPGFVVLDSQTRVYPGTEDVLGWQVGDFGFRIVLATSLSDLVRDNVAGEVDLLLKRNGLTRDHISTWIAHTGGPKVMSSIEEALGITPQDLKHTYDSLAEFGNLSSSSVLDVLARTLRDDVTSDSYAVLMAMGPGFTSESVLLQWSA